MKKQFLFLASLVLGLGQMFADQVTFSSSDLYASLPESNKKVDVPYTWKVSPYHVSVTIAKKDGTKGSLSVNSPQTNLKDYTFTVTVAGEGTLDEITLVSSSANYLSNIAPDTGNYSSGTWSPEDATTSSVTFTPSNNFPLKTISVTYTPDDNYTPIVPVDPTGDPLVGPFGATPIESIASYAGTDPYVFDMASRKYYAYNNLNQYEEFGLYPEVSTLKVAGGGATEIEYIATDATMGTKPFINTGYVHKANTRIVMECDIDASNTSNYQAPFGSRAGYGSNMFVFFWRFDGNNKGCFARNSEKRGEEGVNVPTGEKIKIDANGVNLNVYRDGETAPCVSITDDGEPKAGTTPMYIFDLCHADHADGSATLMKLYTFKIYEGETLVMDLVPVVDGEGNGGLKDKLTGTVYTSANSTNFALSPDGQAVASAAGISVYPGKLVINTADQHEYNWNGTEWVDLGSVYKPITDTNYQNMNNWTCRWGYEETYGHIENSGNNNFFNPYNGKGDWEPYQCKVEGLTKGETYRVSFNFTSAGWNSWGSHTQLPFFVTNNWNFNRGTVPSGVGGEVLGYVGLPQAVLTNQPYSFTFTADGTEAVLAIQFGVGDDDKNFFFHFDNLNIEFVDYPQKYAIDWVDPNKYTPLAYIEGTSQALQNPFTTPYIAKANTEVGVKFYTYKPNNGDWRAIFSGRNGQDSGNGISLYRNGNGQKFGYFVGGYKNDDHAPYPGDDQEITVTASLSNLNVNGTDYPTGQSTFNASSRKISFFSNPEWDHPFNGRIYYFTIKEGSETIYDFQPVMRHDGKFGYYDAATKTFIEPVQGNWNGYGFKKLDDQAYVTYTDETRIVIVGSTAQFLPDVQNLDGATFTWTSSDETKATVAADGTVTGIAAGTVTITVTTDADQGWTASYELTVSEPNYVRHDVNNVGYAIVTGGEGWGDSPVANLIDNNAATKFGTSSKENAWAIIIASEPVAVQQYSFVTGADTYDNPGRTPRSWKIEGSNDNQNWTVIDEQTQNYKAKTSNKEEFIFEVNGTDTYKFFKFSAWDFDGGFQLGEFWINAQEHNFTENQDLKVEATCTKEGKVVYECSDCHALMNKPIFINQHNYVNGVCTVCSGKASEPVLLANGATTPFSAKFRHMLGNDNEVEIEAGWNTADFDDYDWDELLLPVGTFGPYKTRWIAEHNTFWFRRPFYIDNPAAITKLIFKATHDDDYIVYINGVKVTEENGWTSNENDWRTVEIEPADVNLVAGQNVLAVYIEQNTGDAYCDFSLEANVGAKVAVSDAGYATFVAPCDVDFTGNTAVAKAAKFDGEYVQLTDVTTVPAGTAVVVKAAEGTYTVPATTDAALGTDNDLIASDGIEANGTQYILAKQNDAVGFAQALNGTTIAAGKGYLVLSSPVKAFYGFEPDDATGINDELRIQNEESDLIYNLAGQRISKIQRGINIVNNKKILK